MFYFGLFSSHLPYVVFLLVTVFYLGANQIHIKMEEKNVQEQTFQDDYQQPEFTKINDSNKHNIYFTKSLTESPPLLLQFTKPATPETAGSALKNTFSYTLFSRPPPIFS